MTTDPIVVGTDGSASAERAVDVAADLAEALGAQLHVVTSYTAVRAARMAYAGGMTDGVAELQDSARESAEGVLSRSRRRLGDRGVIANAHLCSGDPAEALLAIAEDAGAQMLVVGNRGMTGARRLLGSVPNRISHHARCCVLIVPTADGATGEV